MCPVLREPRWYLERPRGSEAPCRGFPASAQALMVSSACWALAGVFAVYHPLHVSGALDVGGLRWILTPVLLALIFGWFVLFPDPRSDPAAGIRPVPPGTRSCARRSQPGDGNFGAVRGSANGNPDREDVPDSQAYLRCPGGLGETRSRAVPLARRKSSLVVRTGLFPMLLVLFLAFRILGKSVGGLPARSLIGEGIPAQSVRAGTRPRRVGLSIAIAVSALLTLGTTVDDPLAAAAMFDVVVLAVMANELIGPHPAPAGSRGGRRTRVSQLSA